MSVADRPPTEPGWHPDPWGRHQHRWCDGERWTSQVADEGVAGTDPSSAVAPGTAPTSGAAPTLWTAPVLLVGRPATVAAAAGPVAISDPQGHPLGAVRSTGRSTARKVLRTLSSLDDLVARRSEIVDAGGRVQLVVVRPGHLRRARFQVQRGDGTAVGTVAHEANLPRVRFGLSAGGVRCGSVDQDTSDRGLHFVVRDAHGRAVARIAGPSRDRRGHPPTSAESYVVTVDQPVEAALLPLVVVAALAVDSVLGVELHLLG